MLVGNRLQFVHRLAQLAEHVLELQLRLGLGFAERHLHTAVGVDFALARSLDGQENHVLVVGHHRRLRAVGLCGRHAPEGLQRQHHVAQLAVRVVNVLRHFQVSFAAARARVVVGMADALQLVLVHQPVRRAAQRVDDAVILAGEDHFRRFQLHQLVAVLPLDLGLLIEPPRRRHDRTLFEAFRVADLLHHLVDHVHDPGPDRLHHDLRALFLEELEHIEVAVALGGLRPELAGDFDDRLHAEAVHLDVVVALPHVRQPNHVVVAVELVEELAQVFDRSLHRNLVGNRAQLLFHRPRRLLAQHLVHVVDYFVEDGVGLAGVRFERTHLVADLVDDVAHVQSVEQVEEEVEIHFQTGFGVGLVQAAGLLEQHHAEAIEPGVAQGKTVFGFVHAEPARPAGAGSQEDVVPDQVFLPDAGLFQLLQVLHQVADREVRRIALAVVAVFLAELKGFDVGHRHHFALVAEAL